MATSPTSGPGGGGGFDPISMLLTNETGFDAHAQGAVDLAYDHAYDNAIAFNRIFALPAGIGFTVAINGTGGTFTFTDDGLWLFALVCFYPRTDATFAGYVDVNGGGNMNFALPLGGGVASGVDVLPATNGFTMNYRFHTVVAALANPFTCNTQLAISRIA